jgi:magnesium transporter
MTRVLVHRDGVTQEAAAVDPAWLQPGAAEQLWVDLDATGDAERHVLANVFRFHDLAVEDALSDVHHPKIEAYEGFLYLILHGIAADGDDEQRGFDTRDVDFFLGPNFLVTVHHARSRSIEEERAICLRHESILSEGPAGLLHRLLDRMVDHYRPEVDRLEDRLEELERVVFESPADNPLRDILRLKADVGTLRRVALPQRDALNRLARREFTQIPDSLTFRFRDVYDGLVRLTDEAMIFQDRVTSLVDAYLSTQSNRLNQVMKVLTVIATIFMPLTVLTGVYGMNVDLPHLPGGSGAQFWWICGIMLGLSGAMLWGFRRMRWL